MDLRHISLPTGRTRTTRREDAREGLCDSEDLLAAAIAQGSAQVPGQDFELQVVARRGCLLCTVWNEEFHLATMAMASTQIDSSELWRSMLETSLVAIRAEVSGQPPAPWIASRIEAAGLENQALHVWLDAAGPSLAWAWLDMLRLA